MSPAKLRKLVLARDAGVCAACGVDTELLRRAFLAAMRRVKESEEKLRKAIGPGTPIGTRLQVAWRFDGIGMRTGIRHRLRALGYHESRPFWHAHHVLALSEGGNNDPANVVTLCVPCHKIESSILKARLARRMTKRIAIYGEDRQGKPTII